MVPFTPPLRGLMHEIFDMIVVRGSTVYGPPPSRFLGTFLGFDGYFLSLRRIFR